MWTHYAVLKDGYDRRQLKWHFTSELCGLGTLTTPFVLGHALGWCLFATLSIFYENSRLHVFAFKLYFYCIISLIYVQSSLNFDFVDTCIIFGEKLIFTAIVIYNTRISTVKRLISNYFETYYSIYMCLWIIFTSTKQSNTKQGISFEFSFDKNKMPAKWKTHASITAPSFLDVGSTLLNVERSMYTV